ncbi:MAG: helix-turn-helix domain-containing protein [Oscillospiraceae bacterium]
MSLEEMREQNKEKVAAAALKLFIANGIDVTKISDIAHESGLTPRSVYRYFESKTELVLDAARLFWEQTVSQSEKVWSVCADRKMSGSQQIEAVLKAYAEQYFSSREILIFVQEAEVYLHRNKMSFLIHDRPHIAFPDGNGPLNLAIHNGLIDGTVKDSPDLELLYYNAYDSLLGLMQKMADKTQAWRSVGDDRRRIDIFCEMLARTFCA